MKKIFFMFVLAFLIVVTTVFLAGCSNEEETQQVGSETENQANENIVNNDEENSIIKAGDFTLEYGTYIDKYGTKYILNRDGTYGCESTELPDKSGTGTYKVFYFESSMWNIEEIGYPAGIDNGWYIGFNPDDDKKDAEKPWLYEYRYDISENNSFYNAQTDEIWTLQDETNLTNNEVTSNDTKTAEDVINKFYNYMDNKDFKAAATLFNETEFKELMGEKYSTVKSIEESLEKCYEEFGSIFASKIKGVNLIENANEFDEIIGSEGTDEKEFDEILGDYNVYEVELDINTETASDVFILTQNNDIVSSAILISFYDSNNSVAEQTDTTASKMEKDDLKTEFELAFTNIYIDYMLNGNSTSYVDYCTKEVIQKKLNTAKIQTFSWNAHIGKGTVEYNGETYNFTLTLNGNTDIDVTIE